MPLNANDGTLQPVELFRRVREQLIYQFGGVTAFTRNPAKGISLLERDDRTEDDIIVYEVMVAAVDRLWWQSYKRDLEERFQQEEILIRATAVSLIRIILCIMAWCELFTLYPRDVEKEQCYQLRGVGLPSVGGWLLQAAMIIIRFTHCINSVIAARLPSA